MVKPLSSVFSNMWLSSHRLTCRKSTAYLSSHHQAYRLRLNHCSHSRRMVRRQPFFIVVLPNNNNNNTKHWLPCCVRYFCSIHSKQNMKKWGKLSRRRSTKSDTNTNQFVTRTKRCNSTEETVVGGSFDVDSVPFSAGFASFLQAYPPRLRIVHFRVILLVPFVAMPMIHATGSHFR